MVFISKTLSPLHLLRILCAKFGWNCPVVLKKIFKLGKCISTILLWSPLGKEHAPSFVKLESPSPKNRMFCVKFGWNWLSSSVEEDFFKFQHFCYFSLGKGHGSALPLRDALCQVWLKLAQLYHRIRWKCEKFTATMDNRQISIRKDLEHSDPVNWNGKLL